MCGTSEDEVEKEKASIPDVVRDNSLVDAPMASDKL